MKKYLIGTLAIIIAIGSAAFTTPPKAKKSKDGFFNVMFYYTSTDYSQNAVQNKNNWSSTASDPENCTGDDQACKLTVTNAVTTETGGVRYLTNNIVAVAGPNSTGYVPGTFTGKVSQADKN